MWYRYSEMPSAKPRPAWFSKLVCLRSMLEAIDRLEDWPAPLLTVVVDGEMSDRVRSVLEQRAVILESSHSGKCRSFADVLRLALEEGHPGDVVYFAEDDYLYSPDAFVALRAAFEALPDVDYFTLYDHPDRYAAAERDTARTAVGLRGWYPAPSTCLTFGVRFEALFVDRWRFYLASRLPGLDSRALRRAAVRAGWKMPLDELSWRLVLRDGPVAADSVPRRRLLAPVPGLATHCEVGVLSEGVDWQAIAEGTPVGGP